MRSAAAVFAITFLTASSFFAQVHIRENATITPGQAKKMQAGVDHTIRFEFYWSAGADSARVKYFATPIYGCNPDTFVIVKQDGPIVVELESPAAGAYGFSYRAFLNASPPPQFSIQARLFWDDSLVDSCWNYAFYGSWSAGGNCSTYSQDTWMGFCTPFSSSFELSLYPWPTWWQPMYYGKSAGITLYDQSDCNSKTAWYPEDPFTLTIISGGQYASFHTTDPQTGNDVKLDSVVDATGQSILAGQFYLVADSIQPDSVAEWVVVQGESDGLTNLDSIAVFPPPVAVTFDPPDVGPGDTTTIIAKQRNSDGSLTDFPDNQLFEIGIWSGNKYGTILSSGDTAGYFVNVPQGFKFIAVDSIDADSVAAGIRVGVIPPAPSSIMPGNNKSSQPDSTISKSTVSMRAQPFVLKKPATNQSGAAKGHQSVSSTNNFIYDDDYGIGYVTIKREHTILLGETKYYYAIDDPNNSNGLIIKETTTNPPVLGAGRSDVTFDDPVAADGSEKNPVYWEDQYPTYDSDGFTGSNPVPHGMIRLVGRYWEDKKVFKTTLTAHTLVGGRSGSIDIEVKKPSALGSSPFAISRNSGVDVSGNPYSVDSVCIVWGGKYGFPPQNIKGQYESESVFEASLNAYCPGYRYEPWTYEFKVGYLKHNTHFWVTDGTMGDGDPVPDHKDTRYMAYVNEPHSVWYFVEQYSTVVDDNTPPSHILFGAFHPSNGLLTFGYDRPSFQYNNLHSALYRKFNLNPKIENKQANLLLRDQFIDYMSNKYKGGLSKRMAQSRIASSYGPLQVMYPTALGENYPHGMHDTPENLNVLDIFFAFAMAHHVSLLSSFVSDLSSGDWDAGFEETMREVYHAWNPRPEYDTGVLAHARQYSPVP